MPSSSIVLLLAAALCLQYEGGLFGWATSPAGTGFGMRTCHRWPNFLLEDYNPSSDSYGEYSSLSEKVGKSKPDVTVVGVYLADSTESIAEAKLLEDLLDDLKQSDYNAQKNSKIKIEASAINYYAPLGCTDSVCEEAWWDWYQTKCMSYIGGCPADDDRLDEAHWQGQLSDVISMPIFQDTWWENIWDRFGGGEGDVFIYDTEKRLYAYFCADSDSSRRLQTEELCPTILYGGLSNASNYAIVKNAVWEASTSSVTRCMGIHNDDNFYFYYIEDDSHRYDYVDDGWVDVETGVSLVDSPDDVTVDDAARDVETNVNNQFGSDGTIGNSVGATSGRDDDDDPLYWKRHRIHHRVKKLQRIPSVVYASGIAIVMTAGVMMVLLMNWRQFRPSQMAFANALQISSDSSDSDGHGFVPQGKMQAKGGLYGNYGSDAAGIFERDVSTSKYRIADAPIHDVEEESDHLLGALQAEASGDGNGNEDVYFSPDFERSMSPLEAETIFATPPRIRSCTGAGTQRI